MGIFRAINYCQHLCNSWHNETFGARTDHAIAGSFTLHCANCARNSSCL